MELAPAMLFHSLLLITPCGPVWDLDAAGQCCNSLGRSMRSCRRADTGDSHQHTPGTGLAPALSLHVPMWGHTSLRGSCRRVPAKPQQDSGKLDVAFSFTYLFIFPLCCDFPRKDAAGKKRIGSLLGSPQGPRPRSRASGPCRPRARHPAQQHSSHMV